jgi:single-strand DNA-binding protein
MAYLNKVLLIGNLTKDPELRYTASGTAVCDFSLAVNRVYTSNGEKKEETCFIDINVWGRQAESVSKYLHKGSSAFIEGRLQLDQWEDKETRQKRSRIKVVADRVQFLNSPRSSTEFEAGGNYQQAQNSNTPQSYQNNGGYQQQQGMQGQVPMQPMPVPEFSPTPNQMPQTGAPQQNPFMNAQTQQNAFANAPATPPAFAPPPQAEMQQPAQASAPAPVAPASASPTDSFNTDSEDDIPF